MKKFLAYLLGLTLLLASAAALADVTAGKYEAVSQGFGGEVKVSVTVNDQGVIEDLEIEGATETKNIGAAAIPQLKEAILAGQTVKVDAITGATITSKAVLDAVFIALTQAGIDVSAMEAVKAAGEDETLDTEIVIVGCGGSGMTAALAAAEKGAKVVVVEQTASYGGTALMGAEGFFAVASEQQKKAGYDMSADEMFQFFMDYNHYNSYGPLTRAWLDMTASTVDWVAQYGNPATLMENTQLAHADQIKTYHKFDDKKAGFAAWYDNMVKMGVNVIFNTKVTELIQQEDGSIAGIVGQKADGGKLTVNAKAVILSTGGFGANAEMVEKYIGLKTGTYDIMTYGTTGEGIQMAMTAGAGTNNLELGVYHGAMLPNGLSFAFAPVMMTAAPMWVDNGGARFVNEEVVYDFALWGNATFAVGGSYWAVVDSAAMDKFATEGCPFVHSFMKTILVGSNLDKSVFPSVVNGTDSIAADPEIKKTMDDLANTVDWLVKADTIEELAQKMGVPADRLTASVATYNEAVKTGKDNMYLKNSKYLTYSIEKGPFYALKPLVLCEGTAGGISTNEKLQVVRKDFSLIPNLYATGANVGMIFDESYPTMEGVNLSFAINSGRMAGYNAAEAIAD